MNHLVYQTVPPCSRRVFGSRFHDHSPGLMWSNSINNATHPFFARAIGTAEQLPSCFHAVADNLAPAMFAERRQRMNGALKAIKHMGLAAHLHPKRLVIIISTNLARCHKHLLSLVRVSRNVIPLFRINYTFVALTRICSTDLAKRWSFLGGRMRDRAFKH
ncbi:MAG: hypothetical protein HY298_02125 [Verrucomicrobia bacterium]|nr:hypothetical protein [Verrucomicrobiota bacterium]